MLPLSGSLSVPLPVLLYSQSPVQVRSRHTTIAPSPFRSTGWLTIGVFRNGSASSATTGPTIYDSVGPPSATKLGEVSREYPISIRSESLSIDCTHADDMSP